MPIAADMADLVEAQIAALKTQWAEEHTERVRAERMTRAAEGDWLEDIPTLPGEVDGREPGKHAFAPLFIGFALSQISNLYDQPPTRTLVDDSGPSRGRVEASFWQWGKGIDAIMDRIDAVTRLHGTALVWMRPKAHPREALDLRAVMTGLAPDQPLPEKAAKLVGAKLAGGADDERVELGDDVVDDLEATPGLELVVLPRDRFALLANELDPAHVEACVIHIGDAPTTSKRMPAEPVDTQAGAQSIVGRDERAEIHLYFDRRHVALLEDWAPVEIGPAGETIMEHGYGDLPVRACRNTEGDFCTYGVPWGGVDMWDNLLAIGSLLTEYGWTAVLQRGQPWTDGDPKSFSWGPSTLLKLNRGEKAGVLAGNANLNGMRETIMTEVELLARTLDLPSRTFKLDASGMSGIAIAMDREGLSYERRRRGRLATGWERDLHDLATIMSKAVSAVSGGDFPLIPARLASISYPPLPIFTSFSERLQQLRMEREQGVLGRLDLLRDLRPELTDGERIRRINAAALEQGLPLLDEASGLPLAADPDPDAENLPATT